MESTIVYRIGLDFNDGKGFQYGDWHQAKELPGRLWPKSVDILGRMLLDADECALLNPEGKKPFEACLCFEELGGEK